MGLLYATLHAMTLPATNRRSVWVGALCGALFLGCLRLFWSLHVLQVRVSQAEEQAQFFDEMSSKALLQTTSSYVTASSLQEVVSYHPSGTKQMAGSKLDHIVERHRAVVVRDLIAHLRRTTGEDLGDSPEPWIQKYGSK